ncbi:hypothetical protein ACLKA7_015591 [Drosophila subpalustris]
MEGTVDPIWDGALEDIIEGTVDPIRDGALEEFIKVSVGSPYRLDPNRDGAFEEPLEGVEDPFEDGDFIVVTIDPIRTDALEDLDARVFVELQLMSIVVDDLELESEKIIWLDTGSIVISLDRVTIRESFSSRGLLLSTSVPVLQHVQQLAPWQHLLQWQHIALKLHIFN